MLVKEKQGSSDDPWEFVCSYTEMMSYFSILRLILVLEIRKSSCEVLWAEILPIGVFGSFMTILKE
jgi:hypothetical protein